MTRIFAYIIRLSHNIVKSHFRFQQNQWWENFTF